MRIGEIPKETAWSKREYAAERQMLQMEIVSLRRKNTFLSAVLWAIFVIAAMFALYKAGSIIWESMQKQTTLFMSAKRPLPR